MRNPMNGLLGILHDLETQLKDHEGGGTDGCREDEEGYLSSASNGGCTGSGGGGGGGCSPFGGGANGEMGRAAPQSAPLRDTPSGMRFSEIQSAADQLRENVVEGVAEALVCCQQMSVTFESYLDLSGLDLGHVRRAASPARVEAVLEPVVSQIRRAAERKRLQLYVDVQEDAEGILVVIDAVRVSQILAKCERHAQPQLDACCLDLRMLYPPYDASSRGVVCSFAWNACKFSQTGESNYIRFGARCEPVRDETGGRAMRRAAR